MMLPVAFPVMQYHIYRYIIAIDHFKNELYIFENQIGRRRWPKTAVEKIGIPDQKQKLPRVSFSNYRMRAKQPHQRGFMAIVEKMKQHIYRGDVFQIVPSRAFSQQFSGDEFNVYRALSVYQPIALPVLF
jgi:anthranilate synthase component 1